MVQQLHTPSPFIEYPETDGQPITESDATRNYMIYCITALQAFFRNLTDGSIAVTSQVLGLELCLLPLAAPSLLPSSISPLARELRFIDPSTGTQLLTYDESERSRLQAEQNVGEARHRVEQAEQRTEDERQRAERLATHLRSLGVDPDTLT